MRRTAVEVGLGAHRGAAIDQGLGDVTAKHACRSVQVGDGARQAQGSAARGQTARLARPHQQHPPRLVGRGEAVQRLAAGARVQALGEV